MLINRMETRNFNATSALSESGTPIMFMTAMYNGNDITYNKNIRDPEAYHANKQVVDADYEQFETYVDEEVFGNTGE